MKTSHTKTLYHSISVPKREQFEIRLSINVIVHLRKNEESKIYPVRIDEDIVNIKFQLNNI